ncbi:MAG: GNAT family N-acetyltransferase [Bacteroidia bacterium]
MKNWKITDTTKKDWNEIKFQLKEHHLDDSEISIAQFVVCKEENKILGFGRIKKQNGFDEFCSLCVLEEHRNKGIGKALIEARIKKSTQPIYIVTIIPKYFLPFGFEEVLNYPEPLEQKKNNCKLFYTEDKPVVMTFVKK